MGVKREARRQLAIEAEKARILAQRQRPQAVESTARMRRKQATAAAQQRQRERLAAMTPAQRASWGRRQVILGIFLVVVLLIVIGSCTYSAVTSGEDDVEGSSTVTLRGSGDHHGDLPDLPPIG